MISQTKPILSLFFFNIIIILIIIIRRKVKITLVNTSKIVGNHDPEKCKAYFTYTNWFKILISISPHY